ncbi:DUF2157 domain-containing protein [Endozoicomonadaceae bacterium StTr2]
MEETMARLSKALLDEAVKQGLLQPDQVAPLHTFLNSQPGPRFDFTHVLYYFGGMIAIGALTLFMNLGWEQFGGWGIMAISCLYAVAGLGLTNFFQRTGRLIPAGIIAAFVIALTPLAIYGLQQAMGLWPDDLAYRDYHYKIRFLWIYMELGTLVVGSLMLWHYRFPFMVMPVAVTLWYMSMDMTSMFFGLDYSWDERSLFTMWFGLVITLLAFWVDIRSRKSLDFAFWLYLFGIIAFWCGLSSQNSNSELNKFIYCCINLVLIGIGVIIIRRVFVIFGALGVAGYLGHLAWEVFRESWLFPISLTLIGLGIIWLGVLWQKHEARLSSHLRQKMPTVVRELLENRAG